jgi:hypothetical protein
MFAPTAKEVREQHLTNKRTKFGSYLTKLNTLKSVLREAIKKEKDRVNLPNVDKYITENVPENFVEKLNFEDCMKDFIESEYIDDGLYFISAFDPSYVQAKGTDAQEMIVRKSRGTRRIDNNNEDEQDDDPDDLEFLNPKPLSKQEAIKIFTGRERFAKQFKFVQKALDKVLLDVKQRSIGEANGEKFNINIDPVLVKKAIEQLIIFENKRMKADEEDAVLTSRKNKFNRQVSELQAKFLISPSLYFYVTINFGKSSTTGAKPYIIPLKKPIYDVDETQLCLFVRDNKKEEFKTLLAEEPFFPQLKIKKLGSLYKQLKTYQDKHLFASQYDFFFAENEIVTGLISFLGKPFLSKNKGPRPVTTQNVVEQVLKELNGTKILLRTGQTNLDVKVARLNWTVTDIVNNVVDFVENQLAAAVPYGTQNEILNLYVRTNTSPSLPIYLNKHFDEHVLALSKTFKQEEIYQRGVTAQNIAPDVSKDKIKQSPEKESKKRKHETIEKKPAKKTKL